MFCPKTIFIILIMPYFVRLIHSHVYSYNSDNFKQKIEEMDGSFIMFYAPWCHHCTDFQPIWEKLAEFVNIDSRFAIAEVDCTVNSQLCNENHITGYPTLLFYHKNAPPVEYKGTRDLPSLMLFISDIFTMQIEGMLTDKNADKVQIYSGMAHLNVNNVEKFLSTGQHFVMFYASWSIACQKLAPVWADLAVHYAHNNYVQIGKINCMESLSTCKDFDIKLYPSLVWIVNGRIMGVCNNHETLEDLKAYVDKMLMSENHDPQQFTKKPKVLPVARITEETFDEFLDNDLVFVNFFAPWCAHCMQLSPLWMKLGERFQNESRVLIADVDCARSKDICALEKINGLPTLVLYKQKQIVSTEFGSKPLESLVALVQEHLDAMTSSRETTNHSTGKSTDSTENNENTQAKDEL